MDTETNYLIFNTSNSTLWSSSSWDSPILKVFFVILALCMSLITILGNLLVILAFIINKNLQKYSNYFILNLSIADLLIGVLIPPYALLNFYERKNINKMFCTCWLVLDYVAGSASVLCIVVISLDRYLLVSKGLKYISNQKLINAVLIIITVWVIAFLNYAPAIIFRELFLIGKPKLEIKECRVWFHDNVIYLTLTACVEFFVPLFLVSTLNLAVYLNIKKRTHGLMRSKMNQLETIHAGYKIKKKDYKSVPGVLFVNSTDEQSNDQKVRMVTKLSDGRVKTSTTTLKLSSLNLSKDRKAAHALFILVVVFFICWAPYTLMTLIRSVFPNHVNIFIYEISFWLLWLNSTVNPFIYAFLHLEFRKAFKRIFRLITIRWY